MGHNNVAARPNGTNTFNFVGLSGFSGNTTCSFTGVAGIPAWSCGGTGQLVYQSGQSAGIAVSFALNVNDGGSDDLYGPLVGTINISNVATNQQFWTIESNTPLAEQFADTITVPSYGADANCGDGVGTDPAPCNQPFWLEFDSDSALNIAMLPVGNNGAGNYLTASDSILSDGSIEATIGFCNDPICEANSPYPTTPNFSIADGWGFEINNGPNPSTMVPGSQSGGSTMYMPTACCPADNFGYTSNNFTLYNSAAISGTWSGNFDEGGTNFSMSGSSTLNLVVQPDFSVQGTINLAPGALSAGCPGMPTSPALTLSLTNPFAIENGVFPQGNISSVQTGDIGAISASDGTNTIWFVMSSIDQNDNFLESGKFVTGFVFSGSFGGCYFYRYSFHTAN